VVLLEIFATALLVARNCVVGAFGPEAGRIRGNPLYKFLVDWPLRALHVLARMMRGSLRPASVPAWMAVGAGAAAVLMSALLGVSWLRIAHPVVTTVRWVAIGVLAAALLALVWVVWTTRQFAARVGFRASEPLGAGEGQAPPGALRVAGSFDGECEIHPDVLHVRLTRGALRAVRDGTDAQGVTLRPRALRVGLARPARRADAGARFEPYRPWHSRLTRARRLEAAAEMPGVYVSDGAEFKVRRPPGDLRGHRLAIEVSMDVVTKPDEHSQQVPPKERRREVLYSACIFGELVAPLDELLAPGGVG
jgi:hypothetical protein